MLARILYAHTAFTDKIFNAAAIVIYRKSLKPKSCKRPLAVYAKRQVCRCNRIPQMPDNEADPAKGRSRRVCCLWIIIKKHNCPSRFLTKLLI